MQNFFCFVRLVSARIWTRLISRRYILAGFVSVGGGRPAFLIPYFTLRYSNDAFAQELDQSFRIKKFQRFRPEHYDRMNYSPPPVARKIGQLGLLA